MSYNQPDGLLGHDGLQGIYGPVFSNLNVAHAPGHGHWYEHVPNKFM